MASKIGKVRDPKGRRGWAMQWGYCFNCGCHSSHQRGGGMMHWIGLQVHHIIGGAGRSDEPCNYVMLCGPCHILAENDGVESIVIDGDEKSTLTIANCLWLKKENDPFNYDKDRLQILAACNLPDPEEPRGRDGSKHHQVSGHAQAGVLAQPGEAKVVSEAIG